ncbi:MAG: hypothetical protein Kow0058_01000 [Roseovarius sp.]
MIAFARSADAAGVIASARPAGAAGVNARDRRRRAHRARATAVRDAQAPRSHSRVAIRERAMNDPARRGDPAKPTLPQGARRSWRGPCRGQAEIVADLEAPVRPGNEVACSPLARAACHG